MRRQDASDSISYFCAWLALVPQALCVVYGTLIWSTREIEIALMFAGQMGCEALNFLLKRFIKEERPKRMLSSASTTDGLYLNRPLSKPTADNIRVEMLGKGYGMPSSHAQFTVFFALSLTLFLLLRHRPLPASSSHTPFTILQRAFLSLGALLSAAIVAWSRIYLNYHTPQQVFVGCGAGALSAIAWFMATEVARRIGIVDWILETSSARAMRMRDLVVQEDLVMPGWDRWERRRLEKATTLQRNLERPLQKKHR